MNELSLTFVIMNRIRMCKTCKVEKELDEFYPRKGGYYTHNCKTCLKDKQKSCNVDKENQLEIYRERVLKQKYSLTIEEYNELLEEQGGKCAICSTPSIELKRNLAVDHDHKTGKIRGLLCNSCNQGLGYFKDNHSNIESALYYLILHK